MEPVQCRCSDCQHLLGDVINLWTQIGKSYYTPVLSPDESLDVKLLGEPRAGETATLVEDCTLQDIACPRCRSVVGIGCLTVPANHVLDKNQVLLRKTSFYLASSSSEATVDLDVKRLLKLRGSSRASEGGYGSHVAPSADSVEAMASIQAQIEGQRSDIERIDSAGFQIVAAMDAAVGRVGGEVSGLQETMRGLRREVGGNRDEVASLKAELREVVQRMNAHAAAASSTDHMRAQVQSTRETLMGVEQELAGVHSELQQARRELASTKRAAAQEGQKAKAAMEKQAKEVASLRAEMTELRRQMQASQQQQQQRVVAAAATAGNTKKTAAFGSRELDILTGSIAKLGSRASQVETLQMEFAILKGRVQRLEAEGADAETSAAEESPVASQRKRPLFYSAREEEEARSSGRRRKRPSLADEHDGSSPTILEQRSMRRSRRNG